VPTEYKNKSNVAHQEAGIYSLFPQVLSEEPAYDEQGEDEQKEIVGLGIMKSCHPGSGTDYVSGQYSGRKNARKIFRSITVIHQTPYDASFRNTIRGEESVVP
jgi:hypothetical protein